MSVKVEFSSIGDVVLLHNLVAAFVNRSVFVGKASDSDTVFLQTLTALQLSTFFRGVLAQEGMLP